MFEYAHVNVFGNSRYLSENIPPFIHSRTEQVSTETLLLPRHCFSPWEASANTPAVPALAELTF